MRRTAAVLALALLMAAPAFMPPLPADGPAAGAGRAQPPPPWAVGSSWKWVADQSVSFCMTLSGATIRINRITGDMVDRLANLTAMNGTDVYLVEAKYSETLTGTLTVLGFPVPITWPVTGNGTFLYRVPDLALVYSYQHITIDMGSLIGTFTLDTSTSASPPVEYYDFPLDSGNGWNTSSILTVWTKTGGAGGAFETTSVDRLDLKAAVAGMEDAVVPAGTFSCYNITYNGTYTSGGGSPSPQNGSALYSPKATNLAFRHFSPMAGLDVVFALSEYSLNHAPAPASPVPEAAFPEDTTGTLDLYTVFSDPDTGDTLVFLAENFTNITTTVGPSGTASFRPPADWSGSERMVFIATDGKGARARAEVNVTVTPVNDAPVLVLPLPGIIMDEDTVNDTLDISQYFDDADFPYGDSLAFTFKENGSVGVSISPSGIVTLRPFENWSGVENITISATDRAGAPVEGLLKLAVLNTPDAPVAVATTHDFTIPEDGTLVTDASARFWDADIPYGDVLGYSIGNLPDGWDASMDGATGALELPAPADFSGTIRFALTAQDRGGLNATEQLELRVIAVNDPPVVLGAFPARESLAMPENSSADFSLVATDVDDSRLNYTWLTDGEEAGTGQNFTYNADFSSAGRHNLTALVSDGRLEASRTWNITVANVNRPPENVSILSPANGTRLQHGAKANFTAAASDPDGDPLAFAWKDTNGKVLGNGRSFETKSLSKGKHVVTLEVSDGNATVTAAVTLSVAPPASSSTPGFSAALLLGALAAAFAAIRRPGRPRRPPLHA